MDKVEKSKELWLKVLEIRQTPRDSDDESLTEGLLDQMDELILLDQMDDLWYSMTVEEHKELRTWFASLKVQLIL
jgi:hypothetical protein